MSEYKPTIGLEIHAELATETKMFCRSKNDPDERQPNVNICPVCMAHPGTLPVINFEAVKHVVRVGHALGGTIADFTEFDRKNYFYPDIPKGYQISQYKYPIVSGGSLNGVAITRVHLEEDTARSQHGTDGESLVDYNRAGLPLMELVTEPVIQDAKTAGAFGRELQLLLRTLGASEANMEKGEMRVEANVSVSKDPHTYGTKVEVKNINSFSSVERAIEYEIKRQIELLESGGTVVQETRGWDDAGQKTFSQRKKEAAFDYRYFPDPDLPKLKLSEIAEFKNIQETLPELPWERRARYVAMGIRPEAADIFTYDTRLGSFFEDVSRALKNTKELVVLASNYITSDLAALMKTEGITSAAFNPVYIADLVRMVKAGEIGSRGAKDLLAIMRKDPRDPKTLASAHGLMQQSDSGAIEKIVDEVIAANEKVVGEYKAGKIASLQFLVGQGMKLSKGSANPGVLADMLKKKLG